MGDIVQFPKKNDVPQLTCDQCMNASFSTFGIFCLEFREEIVNEKVAEECEAFDPQPNTVSAPNHPSRYGRNDG